MQQTWQWSIITDITQVPQDVLDSLKQAPDSATPFLTIEFLQLLASSKSVDAKSGWYSHHLLITQALGDSDETPSPTLQNTMALVPCYLKTHSYGEYVFDHSWADAYQQHQLPYYPKLLCAVPFTPVTGARALLAKQALQQQVSEAQILDYVSRVKYQITQKASASSMHILFLTPANSDSLHAKSMHQRLSVQFVWNNQGYRTFDDFMDALTSRKRRSIRKERAPFANGADAAPANDIDIKTLTSDALTQDVVDAFYRCYQQTYFKRSGHAGYLTRAFFDSLLDAMGAQVCIIAAFKQQRMIAGSLFFYDEHALYGRYWGALDDVSGLHFECCYYRGIDFAIERGLAVFNPGTQGEHKILRGFRPTFCYSNHYLVEPAFDRAVSDFVKRERVAIVQYHAQASEVLPYKNSE